jgi:hypothetical protein
MLEAFSSFGLLGESPGRRPEYPASDILDSLGASSVRMDDDDGPQASRQMLLDTFRGSQTIVVVFAGRKEKVEAR